MEFKGEERARFCWTDASQLEAGDYFLGWQMNLVCGAIAMISKSLKSMRLVAAACEGGKAQKLRVFPPMESGAMNRYVVLQKR